MSALRHEALSRTGIAHGFFTREGGVSEGIYASLNCGIGSDDDRRAVDENRRRVASDFGLGEDALATPYQVHGRDVAAAELGWEGTDRPRADAVVVDGPGAIAAIGTADCGPILFADPQARVAAAAHAGWKGATRGVIEATLEAMEARGAARTNVIAVLGPTISQENYEVGNDRKDDIIALDRNHERWFIPSHRAGHAMFDLPGLILERLKTAGVAEAHALGLCTYADPERFFSFRRTTHRGEPDYGRMLAAIAVT